MIIYAKDFKLRSDLENFVRNKIGLTPDQKDHVIEGTREDLKRLYLSDRNVFWGISCRITDSPTPPKVEHEKPDRGEVKPFGIDGNLKDAPKSN